MKTSMKTGILNKSFALNRKYKKELIFRYKTRAKLVTTIIKNKFDNFKNFNLLDLGSAEGLTLLEINQDLPNGEYLGIEYNYELIESHPLFPSNIQIIQGDITKLENMDKIKNNFYDVITAMVVLEHLSNPIDVVERVKNILKPGGIFIATCPNPFWEVVSVKLGLLKNENHLNNFNKSKLINIIEDGGMKVIDYKRFMFAPVSFLPYLKLSFSSLFSLKIDSFISLFKIFDWLFVNQCIIGQTKY